MNIKFSIIIPVYNVALYLRECLDSVLSQTFTDWEAICIDDGSTDESGAILDEYAAKDNRFRVFHQANAGVGEARNFGINKANGEYVIFLDGDDTIVLGCLVAFNNILINRCIDILKFNWRRVQKHSQIENDSCCIVPHKVRSYDMSITRDAISVFKNFAVGGLLACGACYRTTLIKTIRFRTMTNGEDVLFGTEVICKASSFVLDTDMICYNYLDRMGSAVNTKNLRHLYGVIDTATSVFEVVKNWNNYFAVKSYLFRKMRTLLLGVGWDVMILLPVEDRDKGFKKMLAGMQQIFCDKNFVGDFLCIIYKIIFSFKNKWVVLCCLRFPWKVRAILLKIRFFKDIWNKIR